MIRRPPRSTQSRSSAASDVYKRQDDALRDEVLHPGRLGRRWGADPGPVSYTHLRAHETRHDLVCRLLLEKKNHNNHSTHPHSKTQYLYTVSYTNHKAI